MKRSSFRKSNLSSAWCHRFTLIEILLVVGLMMLIMAFTVPSFRQLATGKAVDVSCRMITGQLKLARAAAISEQKYLALIMPGKDFTPPGGTDEAKEPYHYRSFRVAEVEPNGSNSFTFVRWYPGTQWTFLPTGAVIAEVNDTYMNSAANSHYEVTGDDVKRKINADGNDPWLGGGDTIVLDDTNGSVCTVDDTNSVEKMVDSKTNNDVRAVVFSPKGRSCSDRGVEESRYITLVEANATTTEMTEANLLSMKIIKVDGMTGRTEYVDTIRPKE